jgi:hypothetical protein
MDKVRNPSNSMNVIHHRHKPFESIIIVIIIIIIVIIYTMMESRDSAVGIATSYGLDDQGVEIEFR